MNEATTEVEGARNPFGATVALAAEDMQGVGRTGYLLDPDNNVFGMISAVMSDGTTGMGGGES